MVRITRGRGGPCRWRAAFAAVLLSAGSIAGAQTAPGDAIAPRMQACTVCHGKEGRATRTGYWPRIAGKPGGYLFNQLRNFRDGRRDNAAMARLVEHMSDGYLREIADYFAALDLPYPPPPSLAAPAPLLVEGERLVRQGDSARGIPACTACHGERMTGIAPAIPGLVGLPRDYLVGQLGAWQTGGRRAAGPDCMASIARKLKPQDVEAVTTWLSLQPALADMRPASAPRDKLPLECGSVTP